MATSLRFKPPCQNGIENPGACTSGVFVLSLCLRLFTFAYLYYSISISIVKFFISFGCYTNIFLWYSLKSLYTKKIPASSARIFQSERGGNRTRDNLIKSQVLYRLSYAPTQMPQAGIEPATHGFSVHCSTNWATEACYKAKKTYFWIKKIAGAGFEPATSGLWARRASELLYPALIRIWGL